MTPIYVIARVVSRRIANFGRVVPDTLRGFASRRYICPTLLVINRGGSTLGEFEMYILAALEHLGEDAYGASIQAEIESRSERPTPFGSVYVTLERLAKKGFVTFWIGEPRPVQGGRSRKHVRITPAGRRALRESARSLDRMLAGLRLNTDGGNR